ncbi:MAG: hypothetical protein E7163_01315 [Firmicutes bacterium]|nr:hypothetical protein [Bacillota bacterium]
MILDGNFNPNIEEIIILNKPLTEWFLRNQEWMAYFELTTAGCLHFENSSYASYDVRILGRMAHAAFTWLEGDLPLTNETRALKAAEAIANVYFKNRELLSENAKIQYAIDVENLNITINNNSPKRILQKHNGIKNRRPGKGHRNH